MREIYDINILLDGAKLRRIRKERGLTLEALAEMIHMSREQVGKLECAVAKKPYLSTAMKISMALDVDINDVVIVSYKKAE